MMQFIVCNLGADRVGLLPWVGGLWYAFLGFT